MFWIRISLLLCVFGFLKEFKPSEPFVVEYLTGPWKNFTEEQIYQEIFPLTTYSHLISLFPVLLLTDFLRYKPIIILCGLSGSASFIGLVSAKTITEIKFLQISTGVVLSTAVAYFSYIYAKVDKVHFQEVTSHARMATLLGRFTSGVMSQLIISFELLNYHQLNYISIGGMVLATIWAFFLPSVDQSIYLHRKEDTSSTAKLPEVEIATIDSQLSINQLHFKRNTDKQGHNKCYTLVTKIKRAYSLLWKDFLLAYSNPYVLKWSMWWTFTTCGFMQVVDYAQILWQNSFQGADFYNGAIEASQTIIGASAAFAVGKLKLNWPVIGEVTLSIFAIIQGFLLLMASQTYNIWISYASYVGFAAIYQTTITIASSEVAKKLPQDSYGLIFGINTLISLLLQSGLTFIVCGAQGFALSIRPQWVVYGGYFLVLGLIFMIMAAFTIIKQCKHGERFHLWETNIY